MATELTTHDIEEIRQLLARFAHVFDNGEREQLDQVFTEDGTIELVRSESRFFHGLDAIKDFNKLLGPQSPDHHTLDTVLTVDADGTVRGRSRYLALLADGSIHNGDYLDVLRRTPEGWRIALRRSVPRYPAPAAE